MMLRALSDPCAGAGQRIQVHRSRSGCFDPAAQLTCLRSTALARTWRRDWWLAHMTYIRTRRDAVMERFFLILELEYGAGPAR